MTTRKLARLAALAMSTLALSAVAEEKKGVSTSEMNYQAGSSPMGEVPMYQSSNPKAPKMTQAEFDKARQTYFERCAAARLLKTGLVVPPEEQLFIPYSVKDSLPFFNINYPVDLEVARRIMLTLGAASQ